MLFVDWEPRDSLLNLEVKVLTAKRIYSTSEAHAYTSVSISKVVFLSHCLSFPLFSLVRLCRQGCRALKHRTQFFSKWNGHIF